MNAEASSLLPYASADGHKEPYISVSEENKSTRASPWTRLRKDRRAWYIAAAMILLLPLLGLLALLNRHSRAENFTSPVVYPSPQGYGAGNWSEAYAKARKLVEQMTPDELNNVTLGVPTSTGCVGVSGSVPRLGFPGFCLHDAGNGVRGVDGVNAYASGLHIGASWNSSLTFERAKFMGAEFRRKGVHVALGPVIGPIGRTASGGRFWEGFGADPYLAGSLGAQTVLGLQQSVIASVKHFIANEQETNRNPISVKDKTVKSSSSNLDDQTMHELYAAPFQDLIHAGAGSVMCSYNRLNNTYACENSKAMNGILKGEMNFQGFVVSDWAAQHSGDESASAGLDMAMPLSTYWNRGQLAKAVEDGRVNKTRLVDMATRIIATWYQFGLNDTSMPGLGIGMPGDLSRPHTYIDAKDPKARPNLLQQAIEGHVLVKNTHKALPLRKPKVLSIFGYDAISQASFNPDNGGGLFKQNWQYIGLDQQQMNQIGGNMPLSGAGQTFRGLLFVGGGSGSNTPAYISAPFDAITSRAYDDGTAIFAETALTDPAVVASSDACLIFINEYASEAWDRPGLADTHSDDLVNNVARHCNNTMVVIHNAGIRLVDAWIDNPNVTAVIFAHLPGQDAGRAVASILYGDVSPSGRLPYTVAKKSSDYGNMEKPCSASQSSDPMSPQCTYDEGPNIDYRAFLAKNITPRYEFGHGLTYSTFEYSRLSVEVKVTATSNNTVLGPVYQNGTTDNNSGIQGMGVGGMMTLFESVGSIKATVTNTGGTTAGEVAQLYLQLPTSTYLDTKNPVTRVLRGFQKKLIDPGQAVMMEFPLRLRDVSTWDVVRQAWVVPKGEFKVFVGKSVLDTPLVGSFAVV